MLLKPGHVLLIRLLAKVTIVKQDFTAERGEELGVLLLLGRSRLFPSVSNTNAKALQSTAWPHVKGQRCRGKTKYICHFVEFFKMNCELLE